MTILAPIGDSDIQTRRKRIHCKQELIITSLQKFYADRADSEEILQYLQGTSTISLRLIDWFVTNYAKQYNISYIFNGQEFLIYTNYKSQLKAYSKKLFDPFCRRERIMFQLNGNKPFLTTVGKLNFFRWAIEKGILRYIKENFSKIEKEMNTSAREFQRVRSETNSTETSKNSDETVETVETKSITRRRARLTTTEPMHSAKMMEKHEVQIEVRFD
uniref:Uncharacterized protein n=1 Tax=viral metagenome TaxID=1070528 RepID=A0A6C0K4G7_9ZZZZ